MGVPQAPQCPNVEVCLSRRGGAEDGGVMVARRCLCAYIAKCKHRTEAVAELVHVSVI